MSTEAPGRAADRQTDVWADRQMTAPEDSSPRKSPSPQLQSLQLSGCFSFPLYLLIFHTYISITGAGHIGDKYHIKAD